MEIPYYILYAPQGLVSLVLCCDVERAQWTEPEGNEDMKEMIMKDLEL